jgi:hypothetical protein
VLPFFISRARKGGDLQTYLLVEDGAAIRCLRCGLVSHNATDVARRYCGGCHLYHPDGGDPQEAIMRLLTGNSENIAMSPTSLREVARALRRH